MTILPAVALVFVRPLHEDQPGGFDILDFELAGTVDRARDILSTWQAEGVVGMAKVIQLCDLVYPLIYAAAIAGGCVAAASACRRRGRSTLARGCIAAAWAATAAAVFDYVENLGLAITLWDAPVEPWPQVSFLAAVAKFALIVIAVVVTGSCLAASSWAGARTQRVPL